MVELFHICISHLHKSTCIILLWTQISRLMQTGGGKNIYFNCWILNVGFEMGIIRFVIPVVFSKINWDCVYTCLTQL